MLQPVEIKHLLVFTDTLVDSQLSEENGSPPNTPLSFNITHQLMKLVSTLKHRPLSLQPLLNIEMETYAEQLEKIQTHGQLLTPQTENPLNELLDLLDKSSSTSDNPPGNNDVKEYKYYFSHNHSMMSYQSQYHKVPVEICAEYLLQKETPTRMLLAISSLVTPAVHQLNEAVWMYLNPNEPNAPKVLAYCHFGVRNE